jgi:hypothetical protein
MLKLLKAFKAEFIMIVIAAVQFFLTILFLVCFAPLFESIFLGLNVYFPPGTIWTLMLSQCLFESVYIAIPILTLSYAYLLREILQPLIISYETGQEYISRPLVLNSLFAVCMGLYLFNFFMLCHLLEPIIRCCHLT